MKAIYHLENFQITNMQSWTSARKNEYCINFFNMKVFLEFPEVVYNCYSFSSTNQFDPWSHSIQFWSISFQVKPPPLFNRLKAPRPLALWMMDRLFPSVKEVFDSTGHFTYPVAKKQSEKRSILQEDWREGILFAGQPWALYEKG